MMVLDRDWIVIGDVAVDIAVKSRYRAVFSCMVDGPIASPRGWQPWLTMVRTSVKHMFKRLAMVGSIMMQIRRYMVIGSDRRKGWTSGGWINGWMPYYILLLTQHTRGFRLSTILVPPWGVWHANGKPCWGPFWGKRFGDSENLRDTKWATLKNLKIWDIHGYPASWWLVALNNWSL